MKINILKVTAQPLRANIFLGLGLAVLGVFPLSQTRAQTNVPTTPFQTPSGEIMWPGWQPQEPLTVAYPQLPKARSLLANGCGVISLTHSTTWPASPQTVFRIGQRTFALNILPPGPPPRCERGMNATVEQFRNPRRYNMDVYIGGFEPRAKIEVGYLNIPQTRNLTANACGVLVVRPTATFPNASISVKGNTVNRQSLPTRPAPICQQGRLFFPS